MLSLLGWWSEGNDVILYLLSHFMFKSFYLFSPLLFLPPPPANFRIDKVKKLEFLHTLKDVFEHKITSILFILDYFANHQE